MGRIQKAYEAKFHRVLRQVKARRMEQGLQQLLAQAERARRPDRITEAHALELVWQQLRQKVERFLAKTDPQRSRSATTVVPPRFLCDAGLGGLARWLRAAGYEALWRPDIDDDELLREAIRLQATLVTTDSMLMERRLLRDGVIPSAWVAPALTALEQLAAVLDELKLPLREPRCMKCGGALEPVDKEAVRERIPPRTYRWLDEYFLCQKCGKLFWRGTHWQRIRQRLESRL